MSEQNKIEDLQIAEIKGLQDVQVYRVCECDAVAAYSLEEAFEWYKETTGLEDGDLYTYDDVEIVDKSDSVWSDEDMKEKITVGEIIDREWNGEPFIAISYEV
jgi:GTP1/Obg family GTP-binding protein